MSSESKIGRCRWQQLGCGFLLFYAVSACNQTVFSGDRANSRLLPPGKTGTSVQPGTSVVTSTFTSDTIKSPAVTADVGQPAQNHADYDTNLAVAKTRVGINFDDGGSVGSDADLDYNDAVLCFRGEFYVDKNKSRVRASKAQTITAFFTRRAACENTIQITVLNPDGRQDGPWAYEAQQNATVNFNLTFAAGSELKVELIAGRGCNFFGTPRPLGDPQAARIEIDVCRTDGE